MFFHLRAMDNDKVITTEEKLKKFKELDTEQHKKFKKEWKEFYSSTTLHGFHYIFDQVGVRKFFWIILMLMCIVLWFYLCQGIIFDYSKLKTVATSRDVYHHGPRNFPTVSICPFNSVSNDFYNESTWKIKEGSQVLKKCEKYSNEINTSSFLDVLYGSEYSMKYMMDDEVVQKLKIGSCTFNDKLCNASVFKRIYPLNDGYKVCYQFNGFDKGKEPRTISSRSKGLWITINLKTDLVKREQKPYHGVAIFIHPYEMPLKKGFASLVPISTGTFNMLFVKTLQVNCR